MLIPIGQLYTFRRCPYAIRARLILAFSNLEVEKIEVDLKNKPDALLSYSPKGTVPVLVLKDGTVIDESMAIMDWVLKHHKPKDWLDLDALQNEVGEKLLSDLHERFIPALNRYKYASRYNDVDLEWEEGVIMQYLNTLAKVCNEDSIFKGTLSKYDIAIFPFIRQADIANNQWLLLSQYQNIKRWVDQFLLHGIFSQVMQK